MLDSMGEPILTQAAPRATSLKPNGPSRPAVMSATVAVYLGIVLVVLVPLYLLNAETMTGVRAAKPHDGTWLLEAVIIAWSGIRLAALYWAAKPALLALTFWIYTYVFFGLAPFAQIHTGIVPGGGTMDADEQLAASAIVIVGLLGYELGRHIARDKPSTVELEEKPLQFNMHRAWLLALMGLAFALLYVAIIGPSSLFQYRSERSAVSAASFGGSQFGSIISALGTVPTLIALLAFINVKRNGGKGYYVIITVLLVTMLTLTNPISSSRFWFGVVVGSIVIVSFNLAREGARFRRLVAVLLLVLIVAFPYADLFRNENNATGTASSPSLATQLAGKMDYDSFPQIALTTRYVESEGHTLGQQAFGALIAPLPRAWWDGKPEDTGIVLAEFAEYGFTSISAPLWSEAWIDGGWLWLFAVFVLLGVIGRRCDDRLIRSRGVGLWGAAVPVFALYQIMTLRGSFLQQTPRLVLFILFFWWVSRAAKERPVRMAHRYPARPVSTYPAAQKRASRY